MRLLCVISFFLAIFELLFQLSPDCGMLSARRASPASFPLRGLWKIHIYSTYLNFSEMARSVCFKNILCLFSSAALAVAALSSCASIGRPSGGPRDEDPPRPIRSNPAPFATGFRGSKVTIDFNEIVNVKDAFSKVVVSPPGNATPRVSALGRRVYVEFPDSLLPNTTYTIDFGNAIEDNNEGNKLENYIFSFSTGDHIDSLTVSGMVLGAADLEPQQGIIVGLHSNTADSAFRKLRFDRISKTDDYGRFIISGLAAGTYRAYALLDKDGDLGYSSPEETVAFQEFTITPSAETITVSDTILNPVSGQIDTIRDRVRTRFLPNNILLRSYDSDFRQQYITKYERPDSSRLQFIFNSRALEMPRIIVEGKPLSPHNSVIERSAGFDSITVWLRHPDMIAADTLRVVASYLRPDSAMTYHEVSDSLRLVRPGITQQRSRRPVSVKKKKNMESDSASPRVTPVIRLEAQAGTHELNRPFIIRTATPLLRVDSSMVHLSHKAPSDSIWTELALPSIQKADSFNPRLLKIDYPWAFDTEYRLQADSLAAVDIYGVYSAPFSVDFKTRPQKEYSSVRFRLSGLPDSIPSFVELLDASGNTLRSAPVDSTGMADFPLLTAGKYNARVIIDQNGNMRWDAGNFHNGLLPDLTYYYPKTINLKQNWSQDIAWDVFATPVDKQKPASLLRNRPRDNKGATRRPEEEVEEEDAPYNLADPFGNTRR